MYMVAEEVLLIIIYLQRIIGDSIERRVVLRRTDNNGLELD